MLHKMLLAVALLSQAPASLAAATLQAHEHDHGAEKTAILIAEPPNVDFGDAFQGEVLDRKVLVTNTGDEPFPLASIQTSCGCTAAQIVGPDGAIHRSQKTNGSEPILVLAPKQEMTVLVQFKTAGKHGDINQSMKIHNQDPGVPPLEVGVHVRVTKAIQVNPAWVNLERIGKSERVEEIVVVEAVEIGDWAIKGVRMQVPDQKLPEYLTFEVLDTEGPRRRIRVIVDGDRQVGALSARLTVEIDHERIQTADFAVTAIIQPNVNFECGNAAFQENINFEQMGPTDKITRTVKILNKDPTVPYILESTDILTTKKDFFTTEVREIEEGMSYEVDVTVDGAIQAAFFRGSLVLRAQHPDLPSKMIPFHGWVRE